MNKNLLIKIIELLKKDGNYYEEVIKLELCLDMYYKTNTNEERKSVLNEINDIMKKLLEYQY